MTRTRTSRVGLVLTLVAMLVLTVLVAQRSEAAADGRQVCHPVNGKGETGTGWNLIGPDHASSHINEATGAGKHTSSDGRTDVYADDGLCPGGYVGPQGPTFPHEAEVCWTMSHSDGVENTYQFPQTRGCQPPACGETVEQQRDTYWIRDEGDLNYLIGLTSLNSPADDARLEPHDYYSVIRTGDACEGLVIEEIPAAPAQTDPCGPDNARWVIPASVDPYVWGLDDDGDLIVALTVQDRSVLFPDGTTAHNYGKPTDSGALCPTDGPTPTEPPVTEPPVTEPPVTEPPVAPPCVRSPWACVPPVPHEPPSTPQEPPSTPPSTPPPPTPMWPSLVCVDPFSIKMTHSDGTVTYIPAHGRCDSARPIREEGF
jgi:hypothetical protein